MTRQFGLIKIWGLFGGFALLFLLNFAISMSIPPTGRIWLAMSSGSLILSIILIINYKLPNKKQILLSLGFGLVMFAAYQGINFTSVRVFICTFLSALAIFGTFNRYETNAIRIFKENTVKSKLISILIGIVTGVVLGTINNLLNNQTPEFSMHISYFLTALSPAISEEITMRAVLYAFCLHLLQGQVITRGEIFTCYFMMVIPHVMIHTPDQFIQYGFISGIIGILLMALIFGLPFAILQRKRDLTSAMIGHGVVDVIRFCFFGLPF